MNDQIGARPNSSELKFIKFADQPAVNHRTASFVSLSLAAKRPFCREADFESYKFEFQSLICKLR